MIRIAITAAAFDAITATLPLGSIGFERDPVDNRTNRRKPIVHLGVRLILAERREADGREILVADRRRWLAHC